MNKFWKYGFLFIVILAFFYLMRRVSERHPISLSEGSPALSESRRKEWNDFIENDIKNIRRRKIPLENISRSEVLNNIRIARKERYTPHFVLFDSTGVISTDAIDSLHLTPEEVWMLKESVSHLLDSVRCEVREHLREEPERAKARGALAAFSISPFEEQLVEPFNRFGSELADKVGPERAGEILLMAPVDLMYNAFGKDEAIITLEYFHPIPGDDTVRRKTVNIERRDGETGRLLSSGGGSPGTSLKYEFPGVFGDDLKLLDPKE